MRIAHSFRRPALLAVVTLAVTAPAAAVAVADDHSSAGGTEAPGTPTVTSATCDRSRACRAEQTLTITGEDLEGVRRVVFLGRPGRTDDRAVRPTTRAAHRIDVPVAPAARSGPIRAETAAGRVRVGRVRIVVARAPSGTNQGFTFPVDGKHQIGTAPVQRFGGARNHQGQDIFASCGTPVVAPASGVVSTAKFQAAAGNYVVIDGADGRSYALMHLQNPSALRVGDAVGAGDRVGATGTTGRATGCQLHFELWTAPGWYTGGTAVDPYDELRAWERAVPANP